MEIVLGNLKGHLRTAAGGVILAAAALFFSCGNPLVPLESRWTTIAGFPGDAPRIGNVLCAAQARGGFYVLTYNINENDEAALWEYKKPIGYTKRFSIPYIYDEQELKTIGFTAGVEQIWLGGCRNTAAEGENPLYKPLLLRYNGTAWEDLASPPDLLGVVGAITPIGPNECWLTITNIPNSTSTLHGRVYKYKAGNFTPYPHIGLVAGAYRTNSTSTIARDAVSGWTYFVPNSKYCELVITPDDGATWYRERVPSPAGGHRLDTLLTIYPNNCECYILAMGEIRSYAIYKRTGLPGAGKYELSYYHYAGPHMGQLKELAMDVTGRALAVGYNSCMIEENGVWREEDLPGDVDDGISFPCAAPGGGFYGFGANGLMYHP